MAKQGRGAAVLALAGLLSACGDGGGGMSAPPVATATPTPTPTATTAATGCSLRERQDWAAAQLKEWYLFPETLPAALDPAPYADLGSYVDALTATARAQRKDRYFTYVTSIAGENAYYSSGSSAGYGFRLSLDTSNRLLIFEAFEGAPALAAGVDRGAQIVAIGTSAATEQTIAAIIAASGSAGITTALGPDTAGTTRVFRITDAAGTRDVTVTKADYDLAPVSSRYGARIINDGGKQVGYVNLRTFITPAEDALRTAFAKFKAAGVTDVIVDLRYNGGGLISTARVLANLLGGNRSTSDVIDYQTFRPEKAANNTVGRFAPEASSVAPTHIAFIGTGGTASASEIVINAFTPYLHTASGLIGTNTFGKPVGQIALDRAACDDRFRVIAFAEENANHQGTYFNGLAGYTEASCRAGDDLGFPLGDPREGSTRAALDFVEGKTCTAIASGGQTTQSLADKRELLTPEHPTSTAQREVPGLF